MLRISSSGSPAISSDCYDSDPENIPYDSNFVGNVGPQNIGFGKVHNKDKTLEAFPAIVHFSEWALGEGCTQTVLVTNCSTQSCRFKIYPPSIGDFTVSYEKIGSLAPGMSQSITVHFVASEFRYYHDILRVQCKDFSVVIPLHGYPIANKVYFPERIHFGNVPLCEPAVKRVSLSCSIPVNFSYNVRVIQAHPYFSVEPRQGVVPANGSIEFIITFNPVTLGTCIFRLQLVIGQCGFTPMESEITGRAVSGIIESKHLQQAEKRVMQYLLKSSTSLNSSLGTSGMLDINLKGEDRGGPPRLMNTGSVGGLDGSKDDPVGMMLSRTFRTPDLDRAFGTTQNRVVTDNITSRDDSIAGARTFNGQGNSGISAVPRGPGSGHVFDAGAQWMANYTARGHKRKLTQSKKMSKTVGMSSESVVSGLRIPAQLNSVQAVVFVLTQEAGKLKPKDLKIAIERNRAERELRVEEQERMRQQGGGMGMDLKGILCEEKLNSNSGDPYKKQLREMSFLADVDDVRRQEEEKEFKVSEEFPGCAPLREDEIEEILHQRKVLAQRRRRSDWQRIQSRQHTLSYPPSHPTVKAGASEAVLLQAVSCLTPSYDSNRNDVWAKRMNTLHHFISVVSRWIIRRRAGLRLAKIQSKLRLLIEGLSSGQNDLNKKFDLHGTLQGDTTCTDFGNTKEISSSLIVRSTSDKTKYAAKREIVRAWVEAENSSNRNRGGVATHVAPFSTQSCSKGSGEASDFSFDKCTSVAELVCAADHEPVILRATSEFVNSTRPFEVSSMTTLQRVLFPKCIVEEGNELRTLQAEGVQSLMRFDDRTYFQLKVRPEHVAMRYTSHKMPDMPLFFPTGTDRQMRSGAPEERALRNPADGSVSLQTILSNTPSEPSGITALRATMTASALLHTKSTASAAVSSENILHASYPSWLLSEPSDYLWGIAGLESLKPRPDLRIYASAPTMKETDADWILRPVAPSIENGLIYKNGDSIRSSWSRTPGFASVNAYLLGGMESNSSTATVTESSRSNVPPMGLTLSHFFIPDLDRHQSGLHCLKADHHRALTDPDPEVAPLQNRQAKADCLTDSESDEDEKYAVPVPSMRTAKKLLSGKLLRKVPVTGAAIEEKTNVGKNAKAGKGTKAKSATTIAAATVVAPVAAVVALPPEDIDDASDIDDKKSEQVELMRDRKILELNSCLSTDRKNRTTAYTDRITELSRTSQCLLQAVPVQTPFHVYEEDALSAFNATTPPLTDCFVEAMCRR